MRDEFSDPVWVRAHFGEMDYHPEGGYVLRTGQQLPEMVWDEPEVVSGVLDTLEIPSRWFDAAGSEVTMAAAPGLYYVYAEAPSPDGRPLRRSKTCCCVAVETDLVALAEQTGPRIPYDDPDQQPVLQTAAELAQSWCDDEQALFHLCAHLYPIADKRPGAWEMHNATQHVHIKRRMLGWADREPVVVAPRQRNGAPAPVLHEAAYTGYGPDPELMNEVAQRYDAWYQKVPVATGMVIAHKGRICLSRSHGTLRGEKVTEHTPMTLHSAMKAIQGVQIAMYLDRGHLRLEDRVGDYLPDFNTPDDAGLDFHACQCHSTGIDIPWEVAFRRHTYFHTWFDTMAAHMPRLFKPWQDFKYGMVGMALTMRSIELLCDRNYWAAREDELFNPMGIRDMWPGGTGFSAYDMAQIAQLIDNHGSYGDLEFFNEAAYQQIIPRPLPLTDSGRSVIRGIGLAPQGFLGPGAFGHAGGGGKQISVDPHRHLAFGLNRREEGEDYKNWLTYVCEPLRDASWD